MIVRHFRTNYSIVTSLIWLTLLLVLKSQLAPINTSTLPSAEGPIISYLSAGTYGEYMFLFAVVLIIGFSSYLFNNNYIVDQYRTFLPMFISVVLLGSGCFIFKLSSAHIGMIFIFLTMLSLLNIEKTPKAQNNLTNASLIISCGSLLDPHLLYFLPFIWISTIIFKHFNLRTFLASLIGLIIPYILLIGILYLNDGLADWFISFGSQISWLAYEIGNPTQGFVLFSAILIILILIVFTTLPKKVDRLKTYSRKVIGVTLFFLVFTLLQFALGLINLQSAYIYSVFPLSIFFSIHLNHVRPRAANIITIVLMLGSLIGFIVEF